MRPIRMKTAPSPITSNGENNNSFFTLDTNGILKTATTFDYETNASSYTITVQAKDEYNAFVEGNFTVTLTNDPTSVFTVAGGSGTAPYYQFTNGLGQTVDFTNLTLIPGEVYEFMAYGISGSHPFMIGEAGGDALTLVSGGPLSADWEALTVTIPLTTGEIYTISATIMLPWPSSSILPNQQLIPSI